MFNEIKRLMVHHKMDDLSYYKNLDIALKILSKINHPETDVDELLDFLYKFEKLAE